jgi:hypothetical protein
MRYSASSRHKKSPSRRGREGRILNRKIVQIAAVQHLFLGRCSNSNLLQAERDPQGPPTGASEALRMPSAVTLLIPPLP